MSLKCKDVMKHDVKMLRPDDTVVRAAQRMRDCNVGFLPVYDEREGLVGTVTDRDLAVRVLAEGRDPSTPVTAVMTREIVTCREDDDLELAEEIMATQRKSRLLCTDDAERLVGVLSLADIAQHEKAARTGEMLRAITAREAR